MPSNQAQGALHGLRVIDVTQVMAGPFCAMLLADFGADVIKVEPPAGDSTRTMPGAVGTDSPSFNAVNRGKRSIVLNLKAPEGVETLKRLAVSADVLVENYRPGVMDTLGLDYASLAALNPRLIYASISGYGQSGPMKNKGGFDLVAQGVSGIMSVTGEPGGAPVKSGIPITDLGAALFALVGVLAALEHRHKTGKGQHVDTSLVDAGVGLSVWEATQYFSGRGIPERLGSAHRMSAPYQAFRCADGFITIGGANDRSFVRICTVLGHPEWAEAQVFQDRRSWPVRWWWKSSTRRSDRSSVRLADQDERHAARYAAPRALTGRTHGGNPVGSRSRGWGESAWGSGIRDQGSKPQRS